MIIKNKLYNRSVELLFNEFRHAYFLEGKPIPSVTKILGVINKPALVNWAAGQVVDFLKEQLQPGVAYDEIQLQTMLEEARKAHYKKKTDAAGYGTFMHGYVEKYIKGEKPAMPVHEGLAEAVKKFHVWEAEHNVKFILSEQVIFSKTYQYSGTLDFVATIDGRLVLGDLKTSSGIYDEMWLQVAAYRLARSEEFPNEKYDDQAILRIGKDGSFEFKMAGRYEEDAQAFLSALNLYNALERMKVNES